jgi:hypothetical protein
VARAKVRGALPRERAWMTSAGGRTERISRGTARGRDPYVGIQIGAVSFVDERTDAVLDILQERAHVNTLWLNTYAFDRATGGRQLPGHPLPDHGVQEHDADFVGGAFYDYDPMYFRDTVLTQFRAPDYGGIDILAEVLPRAAERGIDVVAWDFNNSVGSMPSRIPNFRHVLQIDMHGRRANIACFNNEAYRNFLFGKIEDLLRRHTELAGIAWGCEHEGPLVSALAWPGGWWTRIGCFCADCCRKARDRGISVERARRGYLDLERFIEAAEREERPRDGYFVEFWRLLLKYPEILAWEKLWTDSYHDLRSELYGVAKSIAPDKPFGFHIMHYQTLDPFYRAEEDYAETRQYADFIKPVTYNNCGGPRMAAYLRNLSSTIFRDARPEDILPWYFRIMDLDEAPYDQLATAGLSADYVFRETKRAIAGVNGEIAVYPGIDIDIPTGPDEKRTDREDVREAVKAAYTAGADGVVLSRKYSEMRLENLAGAGDGLRAAGIVGA